VVTNITEEHIAFIFRVKEDWLEHNKTKWRLWYPNRTNEKINLPILPENQLTIIQSFCNFTVPTGKF
jgi:hypothetical protein